MSVEHAGSERYPLQPVWVIERDGQIIEKMPTAVEPTLGSASYTFPPKNTYGYPTTAFLGGTCFLSRQEAVAAHIKVLERRLQRGKREVAEAEELLKARRKEMRAMKAVGS